MDFMTAIKHVLNNFANFKGRARRSEYWWWVLFTFLLSVVTSIIDSAIGFEITGVIVSLALLIPGLAVSFRRMHDTGRSGWWLLLIFVPLVGFIVLVYWFVQRGTVGPNAWGNDPYDAPSMA